jgi:hypothetical protein
MYAVRSIHRVVEITLVGLFVVASSAKGSADGFVPGNVVVYRVGDGSAPLANTGAPVFIDEYTPSGTLVNSVALPTVASGTNQPLIASGTAGSEGLLTRSVDGHSLVLTGYSTTIPATDSLSTTPAATIPRVVGRVTFDGSVDTSTVLTDFADGNNPRSAASTDGTQLWLGGADGGVRYTTLSSANSTRLSTDAKNIRQVAIFDGQLYMSSQKAALRVAAVGTGTPTAKGQSITNLPGFPTTGNPDAFVFADLDGQPGVDTLYVADDTANGGEIQKYSLFGGSWTANGAIAAAYVHGLTGVVSGVAVTLYATGNGLAGTSGTLYTFTDTGGFGQNVSGTANVLATALTNQAFRGVALAPVGSATPSPVPSQAPKKTPSPTAGQTPGETPNPVPGACVGDCNSEGAVSVNDLIAMVNVALGNGATTTCSAGDANHDGEITINEVLLAVGNALNGCPSQD